MFSLELNEAMSVLLRIWTGSMLPVYPWLKNVLLWSPAEADGSPPSLVQIARLMVPPHPTATYRENKGGFVTYVVEAWREEGSPLKQVWNVLREHRKKTGLSFYHG